MAEEPYRKPPPIKIAVLYTVSYSKSFKRQGFVILEIPSIESLVGGDPASMLGLRKIESKFRPGWVSETDPDFHIDHIIPLS